PRSPLFPYTTLFRSQARDQAQAIVATVREPLLILDADLHVVMANRAFYRVFQMAPEDTERQSIFDISHRRWDIPRLRTLLEEVLPQDNAFENFEVEHDFESIGRRSMLLNGRRVLSENGQPGLILLAIEDVTETKRAESTRAALNREQAA